MEDWHLLKLTLGLLQLWKTWYLSKNLVTIFCSQCVTWFAYITSLTKFQLIYRNKITMFHGHSTPLNSSLDTIFWEWIISFHFLSCGYFFYDTLIWLLVSLVRICKISLFWCQISHMVSADQSFACVEPEFSFSLKCYPSIVNFLAYSLWLKWNPPIMG